MKWSRQISFETNIKAKQTLNPKLEGREVQCPFE